MVEPDLDWIVMKALEKDRTRRYETANGLALDLQRHLQNEPVLARPPSFGYKAGKFVRKYRRGVLAAAAVLVAVLAGLVASTVLYLGKRAALESESVQRQKAERHAQLEEAARQEAEAITTFLASVFQSPDPTRDGRTITVAELLERAAQILDTELASQPARRATLQGTIGSTYRSLCLHRDAIPLQEKSRDYRLANLGPEDHKTLDAMHNLAMSYQDAGRPDKALKLQEQVLPLYQKILGLEHPDTLRAMHNLAFSYGAADRRMEALKLQEEVLPLFRKVLGAEDTHTLAAMGNLADLFDADGRLADALKLREEVLPLRRKVNGLEHFYTLGAMHNLASSYYNAGRPDEALNLREEVLPLYRKLIPEHPHTLGAMHNLAFSYRAAGRRDEALKLQEEVLKLYQDANGEDYIYTLAAMGNLADLFSDAGRREEVLELREKVLRLRSKSLGKDHTHSLVAMRDLARSYTDADRRDEALKLREDALALHRSKVNDPKHPDTLTAMSDLALYYSDAGRRDEALKMLEEVLKLCREVHGNDHLEVAAALGNLGEHLLVSEDFPAAELHLLESWKIAELPRSARADVQRQILAILVELYGAWSKTDPAKSTALAEWKQRLADLDLAHPELKPR